jgi:hypothetical protein
MLKGRIYLKNNNNLRFTINHIYDLRFSDLRLTAIGFTIYELRFSELRFTINHIYELRFSDLRLTQLGFTILRITILRITT